MKLAETCNPFLDESVNVGALLNIATGLSTHPEMAKHLLNILQSKNCSRKAPRMVKETWVFAFRQIATTQHLNSSSVDNIESVWTTSPPSFVTHQPRC